MNTCDKCQHFEPGGPYNAWDIGGFCALAQDWNDCAGGRHALPDRAYGWDYEGYGAGVYVGPKFGCIHWVAKDA